MPLKADFYHPGVLALHFREKERQGPKRIIIFFKKEGKDLCM
tara:strand:+ start:44 stop:169 length:126 start_codon:yes stop_codon:yes gene_type:complete